MVGSLYKFKDIDLKYLVNRDMFMLLDDYYTPEVTVPKGFITDGASSGRWLQSFFPSYYKYFPAAVVHDYMYGSGLFDKKEADRLFRKNMKERLGLSWRYYIPMYLAVKWFGASHYTHRKAQGNAIAVHV